MPKSKEAFIPISKPPFPEPGSTIGQKYFSLGKLGNGTFCEISKCVDLSYFHQHDYDSHLSTSNENKSDSKVEKNSSLRVVAAKVELTDFKNSGVLDGEATILKHLSKNMQDDMIPTFLDYLKTNKKDKEVSTIIMEYLSGEDMNKLRDRNAQFHAIKRNDMVNLQRYRRLSVKDSVYLCKDVFLPLLKHMHDCGAIHRDVKPSNCVRTGPGVDDKEFKLVDFGLSKSFVVPKESTYADKDHSWNKAWDCPQSTDEANSLPVGCIRIERSGAEFRGTSMYASLRVHQLKDYCRRDDLWGLMYVFCDLVSGGLPWMGYAANRDRAMCQKIKEYVHGERDTISNETETGGEDKNTTKYKSNVEELLKGAEYHLSKHRRDTLILKAKKNGENPPHDEKFLTLPRPLSMMNEKNKCDSLREIFEHLATLEFADRPDYDLMEKCLANFLIDGSPTKGEYSPPPLHWKQPGPKVKNKGEEVAKKVSLRPLISFMDKSDIDPLNESILREAEVLKEKEMAKEGNTSNPGSESDISRLPLQLQFQLAQVEYNAMFCRTIHMHIAFRDWMALATTLVYDEWDSAKYEKGNHRTNTDGYRRELYIRVVYQCLDAAKPFYNFNSRDCFYYEAENSNESQRKRRKIIIEDNFGSKRDRISNSILLEFSKVISALRISLEIEREKIFAPPPTLSFGYGMM